MVFDLNYASTLSRLFETHNRWIKEQNFGALILKMQAVDSSPKSSSVFRIPFWLIKSQLRRNSEENKLEIYSQHSQSIFVSETESDPEVGSFERREIVPALGELTGAWDWQVAVEHNHLLEPS